ncbi:GPI-anchored protein LLG1 [Linum perenne]
MASCKLFLFLVAFIFLAKVVICQEEEPNFIAQAPEEDPQFISHEALLANNRSYSTLSGRNLVQSYSFPPRMTKKPCKVNFQNVNYLPLRRRCMPPYPVNRCCHGLKLVACNHADNINDLSTKCSEEMFRNVQKWYPIGWFHNNCKEGPQGLACPMRRRHRHHHRRH